MWKVLVCSAWFGISERFRESMKSLRMMVGLVKTLFGEEERIWSMLGKILVLSGDPS
jgi:hypothetical protein